MQPKRTSQKLCDPCYELLSNTSLSKPHPGLRFRFYSLEQDANFVNYDCVHCQAPLAMKTSRRGALLGFRLMPSEPHYRLGERDAEDGSQAQGQALKG